MDKQTWHVHADMLYLAIQIRLTPPGKRLKILVSSSILLLPSGMDGTYNVRAVTDFEYSEPSKKRRRNTRNTRVSRKV